MRSAIQLGDRLTKRDGTLVAGPAMSFSPPFWIYQDGVAAVNYGDDEAAAFEHYDRLVHERRMRIGNTPPKAVPFARRPASSRANRVTAEEVAA